MSGAVPDACRLRLEASESGENPETEAARRDLRPGRTATLNKDERIRVTGAAETLSESCYSLTDNSSGLHKKKIRVLHVGAHFCVIRSDKAVRNKY